MPIEKQVPPTKMGNLQEEQVCACQVGEQMISGWRCQVGCGIYKPRVQEEIQAEYESTTQRNPRWHLKPKAGGDSFHWTVMSDPEKRSEHCTGAANAYKWSTVQLSLDCYQSWKTDHNLINAT